MKKAELSSDSSAFFVAEKERPWAAICLAAAGAENEDDSKNDDPGAVIVKKMA